MPRNGLLHADRPAVGRMPARRSDEFPSPGDAQSALVVEHSRDDRILLGNVVERCGLEPVLTRCGDEAMRLFQFRPLSFALVLLNMEMQEIDGPGTLYRLRKLNDIIPVCCINGRRPIYSE